MKGISLASIRSRHVGLNYNLCWTQHMIMPNHEYCIMYVVSISRLQRQQYPEKSRIALRARYCHNIASLLMSP